MLNSSFLHDRNSHLTPLLYNRQILTGDYVYSVSLLVIFMQNSLACGPLSRAQLYASWTLSEPDCIYSPIGSNWRLDFPLSARFGVLRLVPLLLRPPQAPNTCPRPFLNRTVQFLYHFCILVLQTYSLVKHPITLQPDYTTGY